MLNDDYKDILHAFVAEKVELLLIGVYALAAHGYHCASGRRRGTDTVSRPGGLTLRWAPLGVVLLAALTWGTLAYAQEIDPAGQDAEVVSVEETQEVQRQVRKLLQLARDLWRQQEHDLATQLVKRALSLDPPNAAAKALREEFASTGLLVQGQEAADKPDRGAPAKDVETGQDRRVRQKLQEPISIDVEDERLDRVIERLRDLTGLSFHVNWIALGDLGIGQDFPITLRLRGVAAGYVLDLVLREISAGDDWNPAGYGVDRGTVKISSDRLLKPLAATTRVYPIGDLLEPVASRGMPEDVEEWPEEPALGIPDLIREIGKSWEWFAYGGEISSVEELNGLLIVRTSRRVHNQVVELLAALRQAHTPPVIDTEQDRRVRRKLQEPISIDVENERFDKVIDHLRDQTGLNLYVSWSELKNVRIHRDFPITLKLRDVAASFVLDLVLREISAGDELNPTEYAVHRGVVQISKHYHVGFSVVKLGTYAIHDMLKENGQDDEQGEYRVAMIFNTMSVIREFGKPWDWFEYGGNLSSVVEFDGILIVRTTPRVHRQIAELLAVLRQEYAPPTPPVIETEQDRRVKLKLQQRISIDAEQSTLFAVIEHIRQQTGLNTYVGWPELQLVGVERHFPITLHLQDVSAGKALETVLGQVRRGEESGLIRYAADRGVVVVSTKNLIQRAAVVLRVYTIHDLLMRVPARYEKSEDREQWRQAMIKGMLNMIRETGRLFDWFEYGGTISRAFAMRDRFIIHTTPRHHDQIAQLLAKLRESLPAMVTVEAHVLIADERSLGKFGINPMAGNAVGGDRKEEPNRLVVRHLDGPQAVALLGEARAAYGDALIRLPLLTFLEGHGADCEVGPDSTWDGEETTDRRENVLNAVQRFLGGEFSLAVTSTMSEDARRMTLTLKLKLETTVDPKQARDKDRAPTARAEEPRTETWEAQVTTSVPVGVTLLLIGDKIDNLRLPKSLRFDGPRRVLLTVKPTIVVPAEEHGSPASPRPGSKPTAR